MTEPDTDPVQASLDAYNRHCACAFAQCFADPHQVLDADGTARLRSREQLRDATDRLFTEQPDVRAEVPVRIRVGQWTVDEELVHGTDPDGPIRAIAIHRVEDGLIVSAQYLR